MKKQLSSPCNACSRLIRFFCLFSCKDYDQWHMDQYVMPTFKAPKPVEPFTDLDSKDELIDTLCATINELREDLNLFKAAEQFAKEEYARLQATLMDKDREIARLGTALFQLQPFKDNYEEMGIGTTLYDEVQSMDEILDVPIATRCDYCREVHDPRIACTEYAATLKGIDKVPPGESDPRD